jgi:hypothetical protein
LELLHDEPLHRTLRQVHTDAGVSAPLEAALKTGTLDVSTIMSGAKLAMGGGVIQAPLSIFPEWFSIQNILLKRRLNDSTAHG